MVWTAGMSVRVPKVRACQRLLQFSSASLFTAGAFGFFNIQCAERLRFPVKAPPRFVAQAAAGADSATADNLSRRAQQRWKDRRGLSPFSCCAILLPLNSAKTVTDPLPSAFTQSIRTLSLV